MDCPKQIIGNRILLRIPKRSDAEFIYEYCTDNLMGRYAFLKFDRTPKGAAGIINHNHNAIRKSQGFFYTIVDKKTKEFMGMINLRDFAKTQTNAEIGYWLGRKFWGKSYTSEAVGLLLDFGFRKAKLKRIFATCFEKNMGSRIILEKFNFTHESTARKHCFHRGRWHNIRFYGLLKEEYQTFDFN